MRPRKLLALLLSIAATLAPVPARGQDAPAATRDAQPSEELTADEEREARALAANFEKRLRETGGDIEPLISEFFVSDFEGRLRDEPEDFPLRHVAREVLSKADARELRRFYATAVQAINVAIGQVAPRYDARAEPQTASELADAYPPELAETIQGDPTFVALRAEWKRREAAKMAEAERRGPDAEPGPDSDEAIITTVAQLNGVTGLGEKLLELMKRYLATHPAPPDSSDEAGGEPYPHRPELFVTEKESFGRPAGSRLIRVRALPYPMLSYSLKLVRAGGDLRIISAIAMIDDD